MKKIILQTEIPCIIFNGEEQTFVQNTEIVELENFDAIIYPICETKISPFKLSLKNQKNCRHIETENAIYFFIFEANYLSHSMIEKIKVSGENLEIEIGKDFLLIKKNSEKISLPLQFKVKKYEIKNIENFCLILLQNELNEMLCIYSPKNNEMKIYKGYNFKIEKEQVTFLKKYNDFSRSSEKIAIKFEKGKIIESFSDFHSENKNISPEAICYAFLDCVLQKNYNGAKTLLSSSLQDTNSEKIKDFFGSFAKFFPLENNSFALIYSSQTKVVRFKIENEKIIDFEID